MNDVLAVLCRYNVSIMDSWYPMPSTVIAKTLNISVGKARYQLKKLKEQGLVYSFHEGGQTEDGDVFCYWGWGVTDKAYSTEEYIKAQEEERKLCKECFGIDIGKGLAKGGESNG